MPIQGQLVKELISFWKSRVGAGLVPDEPTASKALETLIGLADIPAGQPVDFARALAAVTNFQKLAGISGNEGVLTKGLVDLVNRLITMDANDSPTTKKKLDRRPGESDNRAFWVRYFVHDSLNAFSGPQRVRMLCEEAWDLWLQHTAFLFVREVDAPGDGVVTVKSGVVPGSGVGDSPVLGPGKFNLPNLHVTLEIDEINTSDAVFRAVAAHEFGHIMGIGHLGRSGNLMSETVLDTVTAPTSADLQVAQRIYGAAAPVPPAPPPGPIDPGPF